MLSNMMDLGSEHRFHLHFGRVGEDPRIDELVHRSNAIRHNHPGRVRSYLSIPLQVLFTRSRVYWMMSGDGKLRIPVPARTACIVYDCGRYVVPQCYNVSDPQEERKVASKHLQARDLIITISETVKQEIVELFGVNPDTIVVAPCAVPMPDPANMGIRPGALPTGRPYFLMVNPGRAYKNWQDAIAGFGAYVLANPDDRECLLVLAGDLRFETEGVNRAVTAAGCPDRIVCLGYVSDDEISFLYRNARIALFPSLYEGFGIPALEAMAHNVPLIISDIPVLKEVAAGAAVSVPIGSPDLLAGAMAELNVDDALRQMLVSKGRQRVKAYSWKASAQTALNALVNLGR